MKKKRYLKKRKKGIIYKPTIYIPTFLGAKLNMQIHNNMFTWPNMESIKF